MDLFEDEILVDEVNPFGLMSDIFGNSSCLYCTIEIFSIFRSVNLKLVLIVLSIFFIDSVKHEDLDDLDDLDDIYSISLTLLVSALLCVRCFSYYQMKY